MAEQIEDMNTLASEAATNAAPIVPGAGLAPNDPEALRKIQEAGKIRGLDVARGGIMGAGLGAQAAQGATNPLTAFLQGAAAGLQAPAAIYAQKQEQVKSTIDAMPFGVVVPEAKDDPAMASLIGLPYGLVAPAIKKIAEDSVNIYRQGEESRKTQKEKFDLEAKQKEAEAAMAGKKPENLKDLFDISSKFSSVPEVADFNAARPAYESLAAAPGDAAGDKTMLINFARLLSPTFRGNEGTMAAVDVSGILDKVTIGLWNKAVNGQELQPSERAMIKKEATRIFNAKERAYSERASFWREKAAEMGFDPSVIGKKYGQVKPMKTKMGEVVYVVDNGDGRFIEVGGE